MKLKVFVEKMIMMNRIDRLHKARKTVLSEISRDLRFEHNVKMLEADVTLKNHVNLLYEEYENIK